MSWSFNSYGKANSVNSEQKENRKTQKGHLPFQTVRLLINQTIKRGGVGASTGHWVGATGLQAMLLVCACLCSTGAGWRWEGGVCPGRQLGEARGGLWWGDWWGEPPQPGEPHQGAAEEDTGTTSSVHSNTARETKRSSLSPGLSLCKRNWGQNRMMFWLRPRDNFLTEPAGSLPLGSPRALSSYDTPAMLSPGSGTWALLSVAILNLSSPLASPVLVS